VLQLQQPSSSSSLLLLLLLLLLLEVMLLRGSQYCRTYWVPPSRLLVQWVVC
jgi:hypothetical protein